MSEQTFEDYVDAWDDLCGRISELNKKLAPLKAAEMTKRKAIRDSVRAAMGSSWKEGTNHFTLRDGRVLKINNKIKREIEDGEVETCREAYELLNDRPVTFDELLRIKRELDKANFKKLDAESEAERVVSRMIVAKEEAPEVTIS